MFFNSIILN